MLFGTFSSYSFKGKLITYFKNGWNYYDIIGIYLFLIAFLGLFILSFVKYNEFTFTIIKLDILYRLLGSRVFDGQLASQIDCLELLSYKWLYFINLTSHQLLADLPPNTRDPIIIFILLLRISENLI